MCPCAPATATTCTEPADEPNFHADPHRQLGEAVDTFPETLRVRMRTAVIAMEEQQEAERAASAPTRLTGFSPRM